MIAYLKLATLQYPLCEGDIRLEYPEITEEQTGENFPCPNTYVPVEVAPFPSFNKETQIVEATAPIQKNGKWTQGWALREMTPAELEQGEAFRVWLASKSKSPADYTPA